MYGYIRQGRRTALTREVMGGVAFQVLTVGPGLLRRLRVRRLLRRMARQGVGTAVFEDGAWRETAARWFAPAAVVCLAALAAAVVIRQLRRRRGKGKGGDGA